VILGFGDIIVQVIAVIMKRFDPSEEVRSVTCVFYIICKTFCKVEKQV